jgi:hypothetical protein
LTNVRLCEVIEEEFVSEAAADSSIIPSRKVTIAKKSKRVERLSFEVTDALVFKTLTIIPRKSCIFRVFEVAFTFWDVSNIVIPIPEFKFQVSLTGILEELADSEVREISIIVRNVVDAALGKLVLIHNAIEVLEFANSNLVNDFAVVRMIDDGIGRIEEIEIVGKVMFTCCGASGHQSPSLG